MLTAQEVRFGPGSRTQTIVPAAVGVATRHLRYTWRVNSDLSEALEELQTTLQNVFAVSKVPQMEDDIRRLSQEAAAPDLWDDPENAQGITSELSRMQSELARLRAMERRVEDVEVLLDLADESEDEEEAEMLLEEASENLGGLKEDMAALEIRTLLDGEYDERHAVVTIRAGAGGIDAADFAHMLLRMYLRWAEHKGYKAKILDTSYAEGAGIKSATFEVEAPYAYGTLSVESGTHRLVRISPFDNQGRRQTGFAAVEVIPLIETTDHIEIPEADLKVDVFRSSGPGGQSVNTTDSAVRMTHLPTGIVVSMQDEKSQIQNRAAALRVLRSRLLMLRHEEEKAKKDELKGDVKASWGDQMRSYVLQPFQMVKDLRTGYEVGNTQAVFDGDIDGFLNAGIRWRKESGA